MDKVFIGCIDSGIVDRGKMCRGLTPQHLTLVLCLVGRSYTATFALMVEGVSANGLK